MRKAFSMIMAIFVIVIMATIAAMVLNMAGKITKASSDLYREEQAALLARSYTELAVLAVINHDRNDTIKNCVENIDGNMTSLVPGATGSGSVDDGSGYKVETKIYYLGNGLPCSNARKLNGSSSYPISQATAIATDYNNTSASDAIAAVVIDVFVKHRETDHPDAVNKPWITYHRRTLQKI